MFFQDQITFSLVTGQREWRADSSIVLQMLYSKCANEFFLLVAEQTESRAYGAIVLQMLFSNVQMTFSLLVARQRNLKESIS